MGTPLIAGFAGFSLLAPNDIVSDYMKRRAKLSGSTRNVRKHTPVISGAGNTLDRINNTGGVNEIQTLTGTSGASDVGGTFTISWVLNGVTYTTASLAASATAAQIQTALDNAMPVSNMMAPTDRPNLGPGNFTVAGGPIFTSAGAVGTAVTITFKNKFSGQNVAQVTITSSLTGTTPAITPTTTTAGTYGYASSTTFIGFSGEWEQGPTAAPVSGGTASFGREFAQAPVNPHGPFATSDNPIAFIPLGPHPIEFLANIEPWIAVAATMVSNSTGYDIGYNTDLDQYYVSTATNSNSLLRVVGIPAGQVGVYGGLVRCTVIPAAIALA